jgi:undecaprenyl-diphosphatase
VFGGCAFWLLGIFFALRTPHFSKVAKKQAHEYLGLDSSIAHRKIPIPRPNPAAFDRWLANNTAGAARLSTPDLSVNRTGKRRTKSAKPRASMRGGPDQIERLDRPPGAAQPIQFLPMPAHDQADGPAPAQDNSGGLRQRALIAVVAALVVLGAGFALRASGTAERSWSVALNRLHHGLLGTIGNAYYHAVEPPFAVGGTVVLTAVVLLARRSLRVASTFAATIAATWIPVLVIKIIVGRDRPVAARQVFPFLPTPTDASYPSGHTTFIAALVLAAVALTQTRRSRLIAATVGGAVIAVAAFLVMVDGIHYPSDALASILWVLGVAPFMRLAWLHLVHRDRSG